VGTQTEDRIRRLRGPQQSLRDWTNQEWGTKSGKNSSDTGERYLPKKAIQALSDEEYQRTSQAKRVGMRAGKQFVAQPKSIAEKTARYR
jgi:allophanate hydrolase subunit 2